MKSSFDSYFEDASDIQLFATSFISEFLTEVRSSIHQNYFLTPSFLLFHTSCEHALKDTSLP